MLIHTSMLVARSKGRLAVSTTATWSNWSGGVRCTPQRMIEPGSEAEIQSLIRYAAASDATVRVTGTGHSFSPLCATAGLLLSLDRLQGVINIDTEQQQATIWAGTKLHQIGEPLLDAGLAMENLGDIDRQSFAGAISTGTHGTGVSLGSLSTQVVGLRLVLGSGELLDCSPFQAPEIFNVARVSLGALGVITRITLQLIPAYRLHERTWVASTDECLERLPELTHASRHFEFFWSPHDDACAMKALRPTDAAPGVIGQAPAVDGRLARYIKPERVDWSHRIFPSDRDIRFNEIEFALPATHGPESFRELRQMMCQRHPEVAWPVEYRTLHSDDIPLSPATGRETVTISLHQDASLPYDEFFRDAEAIFRNHQGRPHWGKLHWHDERDLPKLYPAWERFLAVHQDVDPERRFLNPYLTRLLYGSERSPYHS